MKRRSSAASDRYLWFRPESRWIWFRMAVPKEYRERAGRKLIQFSLETDDRFEASVLAGKKRAEFFESWGAVVTRHVPTLAELEDAAVAIGHDMTVEYEDARRNGKRGEDRQSWQHFIRRTEINLNEQSRLTATGDDALVRELANVAIDQLGYDLPSDSDLYARFCDLLNKARLAALTMSAERALGRVEADTDSKLVRDVRERQASKAKPGETIMELFELWAEEMLAKGSKREDTVNQDRKVIERFSAFVGADRAIDAITPQDVHEYRETMRKLPPKWMSKRELRDLDMRAAADKARALDMPRTKFTNINKHLSTISPLYKWIAGRPKWAGLPNPCNGLFYDDVKGKNPRPPFTTAHLNKILGSPLFTGFKADGKEHLPGNVQADDWRRWVPIVAMFTGARIGEVAQLRVGDVRQERGVWFVHIRHDESEGLATKSGESRPAAVHPMLERLGFLAFHARQLDRAGDDLTAQLFPELEPNSRGQISGEPSRWWRDYLKAIGIKNSDVRGGDGFGAHSFRHTLADRLRSEAELLDNEIAVCLGHSTQSTTGGYGVLSQGTVNKLKGWIEAVTWEGVDFKPLLASRKSDTV